MTAGIRRDIQGLRAIAVGAVVLYHLRPEWLPGGFVGVDVFFVISGYLITGSLAAEATTTGRIALTRFWGRRIRRLMPAATVVLIAVVAGTGLVLPLARWMPTLVQVAASALSGQNWVLAAQAVSYLNADEPASPLQHFWSLSVEEQFYVVWPLLVVAALALVARAPGSRLPTMRWLVLALAVASFGYSAWASSATPDVAYFSTFTRAWELLVGAALALWVAAIPRAPRLPGIAVVVGVAAIVASFWLVTPDIPFPGFAALLPTVGAAAVIWGGLGAVPRALTTVLESPPFVWVGNVSYGLYLWHWPLIVFAGAALRADRLPWWAAVAVLTASLVLAGLSKRFVEDRFQRPATPASAGARPSETRLGRIRRHPFALAAALLTITGLAGAALFVDLRQIAAQQSAAAANPPGARVLDPRFDPSAFPSTVIQPVPDILTLTSSLERQLSEECMSLADNPAITSCEAGDPDATTTVLLAGDSHTAHWLPAFDELGRSNHWRVVLAAKASCPLLDLGADFAPDGVIGKECLTWNSSMVGFIRSLHPDALVTSMAFYPYPPGVVPGDRAFDERMAEGSARRFGAIEELGIPVVAIHETPVFNGFSAPDCLSDSRGTIAETISACSAEMNSARILPRSRLELADALVPGVVPIDVDEVVCPHGVCYSAIGNVISYRDDNHFTDPFARSLAWAVRDQLQPQLPDLFAG
ncbi:acyltransferase family protein [soil metagenome]